MHVAAMPCLTSLQALIFVVFYTGLHPVLIDASLSGLLLIKTKKLFIQLAVENLENFVQIAVNILLYEQMPQISPEGAKSLSTGCNPVTNMNVLKCLNDRHMGYAFHWFNKL